ncbi:YdiY family protein [Photobacterium sp. TY1-4]|uniref:DUF481 domain-containing protein n=1 Tax=Photobacterium sp. TY1-4 TaxID=2899122 RepID=UPI0021BE7C0B|nr:DUF481 domain-containing protein [Photobacterium sp. TY1-4]UXI01066.1 DUF481 domain-containing protein [Photobacterium sp. TY1-4]
MARYLLTLLLLANATAYANDEDQPKRPRSPWASELELGYQALGGNSDSESLNARVGLTYVKNQYRHTTEAKYLLAEKDGEEDKRKGQLELQSDRKINDSTYVLGNVSYIDDRYGPYFSDFTFSTGLGYQLLRLETFQMEVEAGPGYRHQEPNIDEIDDDDIIVPMTVNELILRGNTKFIWKPSKTVEVEGRITTIAGNSNSTLEAELNLTSAISEHIAIKLSNTQKLNSWVPDGLDKRDSIMTINLLFRFDPVR